MGARGLDEFDLIIKQNKKYPNMLQLLKRTIAWCGNGEMRNTLMMYPIHILYYFMFI